MTGDPVRDEAERLVAAAIAAVSLAARGLGVAGSRRGGAHTGLANGSAECCVCPVCRVIAAMRDPSPDLTEKLASGAGDLAVAVAGILRSVSRAGARSEPEPHREGDEFWEGLRRRARDEPEPAEVDEIDGEVVGDLDLAGDAGVGDLEGGDPWRTATRAPAADALAAADDLPARSPMAKKAVRKAAKAAPVRVEAAPAPAKKAVAKKAAKKAAPPASTT